MKKNITIAFYDAKPYDIESFDRTNEKFGFNIKYYPLHLTEETAQFAKGADAVCAFVNDPIDAGVINVLKSHGIQMIALRSAGYNNVDLKNAYRNIHVARVPAYSPYAVAEFAASLMLALNRKTHKAYYRTRDNNFTINGLSGFDMRGKTAGIIGTGRIGKVLIKILKGFDMNVVAFDNYADEAAAKELGFTYVSIDELYKRSNIISLHCPLTKDTNHMINDSTISMMQDGVMIINTGRGQLIDTKALIQGLKEKKIGSAGLDVYEEEGDYFFEDFSIKGLEDDILARLLTFPNVLITSHQAFFTAEALENISMTTLENVRLYFEKGEVPNEICYRCQSGSCLNKETGKCF
ncbi:MAG TPA: 2-hydroxyacid dehydrogenase [Spirochaetota bacterium]